MKHPDDKPTTLEERLIGAFISAIAMACTIAVLSFIFFVITAKGRFAGAQLLFNFVFLKISLFFIAGAAVLGFLLSFDQMLHIFSSLWGTSSESESNPANNFVIVIGFAVAIVVAVLFFRQ
jgi:hypothetical protein